MPKLDPRRYSAWSAYYIAYQAALADLWLIPLLREWGIWKEGLRVLDVGCGQAGASHAFAQAGAIVDGLELDGRLVAEARSAHSHPRLRLVQGDITRASTLGELAPPYDLVLYRDVLEHIPDPDAALRESVERLDDGGRLLVLFPPYWSAFGGHQQTLPGRGPGKWPFAHWLGPELHRRISGIPADDPHWRELLTIRSARLSLRGMDALARRHRLRRIRRRDFLIRPSHRLRYGLPVVRAGWPARLPLLREVWVNGSYQLLDRDRARSDLPGEDREA